MPMPLVGVKVLEMSAYAVGPATAMILGDLGAEVVKVEPLEGDPLREVLRTGIIPLSDFNYLFEFFNRNKKSIAINAKSEKGKEIIYKLAGKSDIFITNYRPAAIGRLAINYETLSRINPKLIYAQITGYGSKGPGKDWPAFDETAFWARSGIMGILGEPDVPSPPLHGALGDLTTSLCTFGNTMLALYERERTGLGKRIDTSLLGSGTWIVAWDLQASLHTGQDILRRSRKKSPNPLYNTYQTKDGRWIQFSMGETERYWPLVCKALDRDDLLADARFDSHEKRCQNSALIISILDGILATKTLSEIKDRFYNEGLVWAPAQTMLEAGNDPQSIANEFVIEYEHPSQGKFRSLDSPIKMSGLGEKARRPAPSLGQHTDEILLDLGYLPHQLLGMRMEKTIL